MPNTSTTLNAVTIAYNHCDYNDNGGEPGGGLYLYGNTTSVKNCILANNYRGSGTTTGDDYAYNAGTLTDNGYNIVEYSNVAANATGGYNHGDDILYNTQYDQSGTSFSSWTRGGSSVSGSLGMASDLADNGGPTQTLAITSPAGIAVGNGFYDAVVTTTDQRGATRHNPGQTIGAYEFYADYTTNGTGTNWSTAANWDMYNGVTTTATTVAPNADNSTSITVNHDMTVNTDVSVDQATVASGKTLTVDGTHTLTVANGNGTDLTAEGALTVQSGGTLKIASGASVDSNGGFTVNGTLSFDDDEGADDGTLTIATGAPTITTLTAGSGTITYDGADQTLATGEIHYSTVSLDGSGTKTASLALTAETLSVPNEAVNVVLNGTGTRITNPVLFENTGTLTLGGASTDALTFTGGISIRESNGPSAVSLQGFLTTSNETNADVVLRRTTITGNATINSGVNGIDIYDELIINDGAILTTISASDSKMIYFHSTINSAAGGTGHLTLSPNFAVKFAGNVGGTTPLGTITVTSGYVEWTYPNITLENLLINGGYLGGVSPSGNMDVGNVTVASGATLKGTTGAFNVSGDWTNNGTFSHNDGTVTFVDNRVASSITGSTTFYNFTCTTAGKTLNFDSAPLKTQTIEGWFTLTGTSGSPIVIGPTTASDTADINVTYDDVRYVSVSYSNNTGSIIYAADSTESAAGTTSGWDFGFGEDYVWIGKTDSDWDTATNWVRGVVPGPGENITVSPGANDLVINDNSRTVNNFTIDSGAPVGVDNSKKLTVSGTLQNNDTLTVGTGTVEANGMLDNNGTLSIGTGTADANGTFDATGGTVTFTGAGNLKLGGTVNSLGTLSTANGTVWYDLEGNQAVLADNYPGLRISGDFIKTLAGDLTVNGNLTIDASTTLDAGEGDDYGIILKGDWLKAASGTFEPREGTVTLSGSGGSQQLGAGRFYDLTTNGEGDVNLSGEVTVEKTFTTGPETDLYLGSNTLNIGSAADGTGSWINDGTFWPETGTVNYGDTNDQNILLLNYYGLGLSGEGSEKTFPNGDTTVKIETVLTDTITLTGSSSDAVTVQVTTPAFDNEGNENDSPTESRVFNVNAEGKTVTISNMTIRGGDLTGSTNAHGGCIWHQKGTLNLDSVVVGDAKAFNGGGIAAFDQMSISDSTIRNNSAFWGAALYTDTDQTVTLSNTTISGNSATFSGVIWADPGDLVLTDVTVFGNEEAWATLGCVTLDGGTSAFKNVTIAGNTTKGAGLFLISGALTIRNSLLANNVKDGPGADYFYNGGTLTDLGYNVVEDQSGDDTGEGKTFTHTTDILYNTKADGTAGYTTWNQNNTDLENQTLGLASSLADNGGPTQTLALGADSFARGAIPYADEGAGVWNGARTTGGNYTDQRGAETTPTDPICIGAYEFYADYTTKTSGGWTDPTKWKVFNGVVWDENPPEYPTADNSTKITVDHDIGIPEDVTIDQTTVSETGTLTVEGNPATLTIANGDGVDLTVTGSLVNADVDNNTITCQGDSTVLFNGTDQNMGGNAAFQNVEISGGGTKTPSGDNTINQTLTLTNGLVSLGDNDLTLGENADIGGTPSAASMIVTGGSGVLKKIFTDIGSFTFPLGDATSTAEYSPATLNFTAGTFNSAWAAVKVTTGKTRRYSS